MIIIPFEPEHLKTLKLQEAQKDSEKFIHEGDYGATLKGAGPAWSVFDEESVTCLMSGGFCDVGFGRAVVWLLVSEAAGKHFTRVLRFARRMMQDAGFRRIEAVVDGNFEQGHRLAKMMGFICETPDGMKQYYADGRSAHLYSWVK